MSDIEVLFETDFSVIGPEIKKRFFPFLSSLPKPGQWVYVERQRQNIPMFLAHVTDVNIEQVGKDLYKCTVTINRKSVKENVLFAKLARRTFDLLELEKELLEPLDLIDTIGLSEDFSIVTRPLVPSYSNANYSGNEVSGQ